MKLCSRCSDIRDAKTSVTQGSKRPGNGHQEHRFRTMVEKKGIKDAVMWYNVVWSEKPWCQCGCGYNNTGAFLVSVYASADTAGEQKPIKHSPRYTVFSCGKETPCCNFKMNNDYDIEIFWSTLDWLNSKKWSCAHSSNRNVCFQENFYKMQPFISCWYIMFLHGKTWQM